MNAKIRTFLRQQALAPFEVMWAFFCIYAGIAALCNFGVTVSPLAHALGPAIAAVFNSIFLIAGLAIYFGCGWRKGQIEAFGLILLASSLMVRSIATAWLLGPGPMLINGLVLNAAFIVSCVVRIRTLWKWSRMLPDG